MYQYIFLCLYESACIREINIHQKWLVLDGGIHFLYVYLWYIKVVE